MKIKIDLETDNEEIIKHARKFGNNAHIILPKEFIGKVVSIKEVDIYTK